MILLAAMALSGTGSARVADWPHDGKYGMGTRHLIIRNHLPKDLYIDVLSGGNSLLKSDEFMLPAGGDTVYEVPNVWRASRLWGRTEKAQTGPSTLVEWTMGKRDWYDISLVDGYNLPVTVAPVPGTYAKIDANDPLQCGTVSCAEDLLPDCPPELQKKDALGQVVQCLSACSKYNKDEYCCRGIYDSAQICRPETWEMNYPATFKAACPTAVTYAFDDSLNTFICPSGSEEVGPDYEIGFGALRATSDPIAVFTAPAIGRLRVSLEPGLLRFSRADGGDLRIGLYDARGRTVLEKRLSASAGSFAVPALRAGVYVAAVYAGGRFLESRELRAGDSPAFPGR
ncbi:MAG: thaumatin-like protein [Fibrobacteres bacterium]|nr:thaumatin-like protein [Fibrobacterota bacterium]